MKKRLQFSIVTLTVLGMGPIFAAMPSVTETYDVPYKSCEGLAAHGIQYTFTIQGIPSLECAAGVLVGPGLTNNISPPNIEGNSSGVLHLTFDVPTTKLGFGVAQSTYSASQEVIIHLYRPGVELLRQVITLDTTQDPLFDGGRFDYDGPAVKTATIEFSNPDGRFAIDNVNYFRPAGQTK